MTYSPETLEAIQLSIEHWRKNVELARAGKLTHDQILGFGCALCDKFFIQTVYANDCTGCPLLRAGAGCYEQDSPWRNVNEALRLGVKDVIVSKAEDMLSALENLLNEENGND